MQKRQSEIKITQDESCHKLTIDMQNQRILELEQQLASARRDATEEVAKAYKRGWEQAKREAKSTILDHFTCCDFSHGCDHDWCNMLKEIADAIAAMEYKEGDHEM